ncbi:hypothetical protein HaLaN_08091 [Haematococcus lacustris]|uniref:Uncharacterized protein n=1 Tax=Haematococcus lacustris TaxID=44745 RepID=A0A699YY93_HAELA|nr:hypothetical protein HaLaN_08091 [Haematococcus lacustris]
MELVIFRQILSVQVHGFQQRSSHWLLRIRGASTLASDAMPAQAIADTPQLFTVDCSSGGELPLGKFRSNIAANPCNMTRDLRKYVCGRCGWVIVGKAAAA